MDVQSEGSSTRDDDRPEAQHTEATVEGLVRERLVAELGGLRGSLESAGPIAVFALVYAAITSVPVAVVAGVGTALLLLVVRLVQRSTLRYVGHGLAGIGLAAVIALATGRAETAFLPGIVQSAAWAVGLALSVIVRRPAAGYAIGALIGDLEGWRDNPAIVRLSDRLTLVLMAPMLLRVAVQLPLFLAAEVGWLGVSRVVLGWPLTVATLAVAGGMLARGRTPLRQ